MHTFYLTNSLSDKTFGPVWLWIIKTLWFGGLVAVLYVRGPQFKPSHGLWNLRFIKISIRLKHYALRTVYAIFSLLFCTSFSIMGLKTNHKNIDFKYQTSITDILEIYILKCTFCHGEMVVIIHGNFDNNIRCSLYNDVSHNLQPTKSNFQGIKFCWFTCIWCLLYYYSSSFFVKNKIFSYPASYCS